MTAPDPASRPSRAITILAVGLLLGGPPLEYLWYNHYPLATLAGLAGVGILALCAAVIGFPLNRAPRPLRIALFWLLLVAFVDGQFSHHFDFSLKLVPLGLLVAAWILEQHLERIIVVALAAFYLASLPAGRAPKSTRQEFAVARQDSLRPPIIYLILDEHIGDQGWPREFASTRQTQARTRAFYSANGFREFGRAYSEYAGTRSSIPAVLNWPVDDPFEDVAEVVPGQRFRLKINGMFSKLSTDGYRIRVYQSTYLDYCDSKAYAIASCETGIANSVSNIALLDLPPVRKAVVLAYFFLEYNSRLYVRIHEVMGAIAGRHGGRPWEASNGWYTFPRAMELLHHLQHDVRSEDPRGTIYFAHLLAPHSSYLVDDSCHPWSLERLRQGRTFSTGTRSADERAQRYELYAGQVACLYNHLDTLFRAIDSIPADRRPIVIIHGDHGSRIPLHDPDTANVALIESADLRDAFSTLFAVRAPGIPAGYDERFVPVNELVGRLIESRFTRVEVPGHEPRVVRIGTGFGKPFMTLALSDTALILATPPPAGSAPALGASAGSRPDDRTPARQ